MTDHELKYYEALQPLFREKMGPIMPGDKAEINGMIGFCIREVDDFSLYEFITDDGYYNIREKFVLRLPLPIDPVNPERGFEGMLKRPFVLYAGREITWVDDMSTSATPTLALLKALAHQEGIKVKG